MNPPIFLPLSFLLFFLIFSILSLTWLLPTSASTDYQYPQNCQPQSCGNLIDVSFPFWFQKLQPDYCGYPAFELQCEDGNPKFSLPDDVYDVLNISNDKRTVTVSMARFASGDTCNLPLLNLSFSLTPFTISSLNRELVFVYNCSTPKAGSAKINCYNNSNYAYLGGTYRAEESEGSLRSCQSVVMPVLSSPDPDAKNYPKLLADGFLLNWIAPDCSECTKSNGQCGYDNVTRNFMCICPDRPHLKSCSEGSSKTALIIGLSMAGGLSFIMFCSLCFLLYRRWKKKQFGRSNLFNSRNSFMISKFECEQGSSLASPVFSYAELYEATNGFDASKELGDGGFGTVYKGKLKDGRVVAVKRLYENNYRRLEQFMNEVKILSLLRHQNLVTLYGCTSRRSRELLLVYEFIPNGTVADHLHGRRISESLLPWKIRLRIAIETADALNYLHSTEPQIIHRDIKTTNILLDSSFHVKVADFGLSRLFPSDATHVSTAPQGTAGYVDPEYHQCYQLTDKSDVYSFGVVLMELISSMPAIDISRERHEVNLSNLAIRKIQQQELDGFIDPRLGYDLDYRIKGMITEVAGLGLRCLHSEGEVRPGIKEVLQILRVIERSGWKGEVSVEADVQPEEAKLLKCVSPYSPDTVTGTWQSTSSSMASFTT